MAPLPFGWTHHPTKTVGGYKAWCESKEGKEWKVKGKPIGRALVLDFSSKGGPKEVVAKWTGLGLAFDDGNVWTKK